VAEIIAKRMSQIQPFYVMNILAKAKAMEAQGHDIVHLEIGEPDFVTAKPIVDAGIHSLNAGLTHYTPAVGLASLREAIAEFYHTTYQVSINPEQVIVTPGSSGALQLLLSILINPGDKVLLTDPGYPCNRHFVRLLEGEAVNVKVDATTNYQLTPALIKQYWDAKTRALLIASPSNPTGAMLSGDELQSLISQVNKHQGVMIVDEIYHGLCYGKKAHSALEYSDDVFVVNSFSKYFGMTGWRVGWIISPEAYIVELDKLAQNLFLATSTTSQYGAIEAFSPATMNILEDRRCQFQQRRNFLLKALKNLGFGVPVDPDGAFYIYCNCEKFTDDSFLFCQKILEETGVAITPGKDFGIHNASKHLRFAYTTSIENMEKGIERLAKFLKH
jgi:aspartate/methionine/tyrosine aminotransferase